MAAAQREGKGEPRPPVLWVALGAAVASAGSALLHHLASAPPTPARVPMRQPGDDGSVAWDTFEEAEAVTAVRGHTWRSARRCSLTPWPLCCAAQGAKPDLSDLASLGWTAVGEYAPTEVDAKDVGTPDEWVPRHPDLVRLTGAATRSATVTPSLSHSADSLVPAARSPSVQLRAAAEQADGMRPRDPRGAALRAQPRGGAPAGVGHAHSHPGWCACIHMPCL